MKHLQKENFLTPVGKVSIFHGDATLETQPHFTGCLLCLSIPVPINRLAFKTNHEYLGSQSKVNLVIMYPASPTETGQARKQNTVQRSEHNRNVGRDVQNIMGYRQSRFLLGSGVLGQVRG